MINTDEEFEELISAGLDVVRKRHIKYIKLFCDKAVYDGFFDSEKSIPFWWKSQCHLYWRIEPVLERAICLSGGLNHYLEFEFWSAMDEFLSRSRKRVPKKLGDLISSHKSKMESWREIGDFDAEGPTWARILKG